MTNKNYDFSLVGKDAENFDDFFGAIGVNGVGCFVGKNYFWIIDEGSGYEYAVVFAAGKILGILVCKVGNAEFFQQASGPLDDFCICV